ncbi:chorismate synthase [Treponema sp.]|uniref:chorismate synthase n=1 Tax=Treponema sp. TaxID=166 RepID=UPI0025D46C8A|nr:chorismate synthase [Treponema sp.]MCR5218253.1 chorismate synthase [Treponema sp.]
MAGNTFGQAFRVTTFGESHGEGLGCIIDGCPAGIKVDEDFLQAEMDRRKPGAKSAAVTARKESDRAVILSGVFEGKTTGTSIAILIKNENQHSGDYSNIKDLFRPGHGDYTYFEKYGIRDYRGGGRSSGRETCARVAAGAFAKMFLAQEGIKVTAYTKKAAGISAEKTDLAEIENNLMRCADKDAAEKMLKAVDQYRMQKNSCGGIVECIAQGVSTGLGEPVFDKADALIAHAILSIGAVKGIEFGSGFDSADSDGKSNNDQMREGPVFESNNAGGILAGITNGNDIIFRAAVKPVPSIYLEQKSIDINGKNCDVLIEGRHDICLCPRIVPVIEAMTAITLADLLLRNRASRA